MYILACGRLIDMNFIGLVKQFSAKKTEYQKLMASNKPALEGLPQKLDVIKLGLKFNDSEVQKGEIPSANMHGSAKGMAKIASIMANKGKYYPEKQSESVEEGNMISEDTWKKMHEGEKVSVDSNMLGMSKLLINTVIATRFITVLFVCMYTYISSTMSRMYYVRSPYEFHARGCVSFCAR